MRVPKCSPKNRFVRKQFFFAFPRNKQNKTCTGCNNENSQFTRKKRVKDTFYLQTNCSNISTFQSNIRNIQTLFSSDDLLVVSYKPPFLAECQSQNEINSVVRLLPFVHTYRTGYGIDPGTSRVCVLSHLGRVILYDCMYVFGSIEYASNGMGRKKNKVGKRSKRRALGARLWITNIAIRFCVFCFFFLLYICSAHDSHDCLFKHLLSIFNECKKTNICQHICF